MKMTVRRTAVLAHQLVSRGCRPPNRGPSRPSSHQLVSLTGPAGRPRTPNSPRPFLFHYPRPSHPCQLVFCHRAAVPRPSTRQLVSLTRVPAGHPRPFPVPTNWSSTTGRPSPAPDPDANGQVPRTVLPPTNWSHTPGRPARPPAHQLVLLTTPGSRPFQTPPLSRQLVRHRTAVRPRRPKSPIPVANWSSTTVARPVPGPKSRPTGPTFPSSTVPPAVKGWPTGLVLAEDARVQNFFFRPAAGRPGLANWSGVCGWWARGVAGRFWVVFPENGGRPPGKILPTPVPYPTNWSHDPDPKRTGAGPVPFRKGPSRHPLHKLSPGELYDGGVKKPDVAGLASRDRNN